MNPLVRQNLQTYYKAKKKSILSSLRRWDSKANVERRLNAGDFRIFWSLLSKGHTLA